jgi:hypothetical protein
MWCGKKGAQKTVRKPLSGKEGKATAENGKFGCGWQAKKSKRRAVLDQKKKGGKMGTI